MYCPESYHNTDELYHYGVLGMRWRFKKGPQVQQSNGNNRQKNTKGSNKKKWSTKKKVAVGLAAVAALGAGAYGYKKLKPKYNDFRSKVFNKNLEIAQRNYSNNLNKHYDEYRKAKLKKPISAIKWTLGNTKKNVHEGMEYAKSKSVGQYRKEANANLIKSLYNIHKDKYRR
jgi:uncharacterized protein HemX